MTGPSASLVQSVMAAGLADPHRLQEWVDEPELLERHGIDPAVMDLSSLADFAGLSEKVRHNQCREHLELTFRFMRLAGIEVQLFRCYAPRSRQRRRQGLTSVPDRLQGLAEFVEEWAGQDEGDRRVLCDVLWHEYLIAVLRDTDATPDPGDHAVACGIPVHDGRIVFRRTTCNPLQVAEVLRARDPDLAAIERGAWTFVYHGTPEGTVRILDVESGVPDLLLAVDGRSSVEEIARRLFGDDALAAPLRATLDQLVQLRLLAWGGDGGAPCG